MNHNNVTNMGARAIFMALRQRTCFVDKKLLVGMQSCELGSEVSGLFDMYKPSGSYDLSLEEPYDYMVARMLTEMANRRLGCEMKDADPLCTHHQRSWKNLTFNRGPTEVNNGSPKSVLGARGGGKWKPVAMAIMKTTFGQGKQDILLEDLNEFFFELGLEPNPVSLSSRICHSFNVRRRQERELEIGDESSIVRGDSDSNVSVISSCPFVLVLALLPTVAISNRPSMEETVKSEGLSLQFSQLHDSPGLTAGDSSPGISYDHPPGTNPNSLEFAKYVFELVFAAADIDSSGCIDQSEFIGLMYQLGTEIPESLAKHSLARYDIDRSGTIETGEFIDLILHEFGAQAFPTQGALCEGFSNKKWEVPREGRFRCTFIADRVAPSLVEIATEEAVEAIISNIRFSAETEQDKLDMFQLATEGTDFYMTSLNAQAIVDEWNNGINLVSILEVLLPQMASARNAVSLLENNLSYKEKLELRNRLGQAWGPLVGNPTGFYSLDLSDKRHRTAAKSISMVNNTEYLACAYGAAGRQDTSQRGNWNNFRNETFMGKPLSRGLDGPWFIKMPDKGRLRFDYVSTMRSLPGTKPISERRFNQVCS
ncbi:unnamed protein product [Choristocarpus tenellus]